jgi:hypothetical protein
MARELQVASAPEKNVTEKLSFSFVKFSLVLNEIATCVKGCHTDGTIPDPKYPNLIPNHIFLSSFHPFIFPSSLPFFLPSSPFLSLQKKKNKSQFCPLIQFHLILVLCQVYSQKLRKVNE